MVIFHIFFAISIKIAKKNKQRKNTIICLIDKIDFNFEFIKINYKTCIKHHNTCLLGINYLMSTLAPASVNFFAISFASSGLIPSLITHGTLSTAPFASIKPNPVISR